MGQNALPYSIFRYIIDEGCVARERGEELKLPPMDELAESLGVSRGKLREELIAIQAYGIAEMRPGDGTYVLPFDFYTATKILALYAIECDRKHFDHLYEVRVQLEFAFWERAARSLTQEDKNRLQRIVEQAEKKLHGTPVEIPHSEHREFHTTIFGKLDNEFAQGILKAYWDAYEAVGLHRYFDLSYYESMWDSHRKMVAAIVEGRYEDGREILTHHFTLLGDRLQSKQ
ncbi:MAG: FadR family transcriptional regulator [Anaerolineae bacterium]|nr:FadR family transcriptional regulator [Anaerolineae bacterium]